MKKKHYYMVANIAILVAAMLVCVSAGIDGSTWQYWAMLALLAVNSIVSFVDGLDRGCDIMKDIQNKAIANSMSRLVELITKEAK
jgi:hypothetical protein